MKFSNYYDVTPKTSPKWLKYDKPQMASNMTSMFD